VLPVILVADVLKEGPSPCAIAARRGALLAALNMGDQVMQRLCTCADDKAGDQQVGPEWRCPGAVGPDSLHERDIQLGAKEESKTRRHTPGDDRGQSSAHFNRELALYGDFFRVIRPRAR
jgi:hypothetical protein